MLTVIADRSSDRSGLMATKTSSHRFSSTIVKSTRPPTAVSSRVVTQFAFDLSICHPLRRGGTLGYSQRYRRRGRARRADHNCQPSGGATSRPPERYRTPSGNQPHRSRTTRPATRSDQFRVPPGCARSGGTNEPRSGRHLDGRGMPELRQALADYLQPCGTVLIRTGRHLLGALLVARSLPLSCAPMGRGGIETHRSEVATICARWRWSRSRSTSLGRRGPLDAADVDAVVVTAAHQYPIQRPPG